MSAPIPRMTDEQFRDWIAEQCEQEFSCLQRRKPLLRGVWGDGGFSLSTAIYTGNDGLDAIFYVIGIDQARVPLCIADTKVEAIAKGRDIIERRTRSFVIEAALRGRAMADAKSVIAKQKATAAALEYPALPEWADTRAARVVPEPPKEKPDRIPSRRRRVFVASDGKCHYCKTVLTLDGRWHIDHKTPRALGGSDKPGNLVASCVECNLTKKDMTEQEFRAGQRADIEGETA